MAAIQFTALIRLPFARGEFVDPPQADWSATKDRALWKVISKSSKTSDLNWPELATRFQVPQTFLLQQAAWLYERHLEHVRNQMKKVGGVNPVATSGINSSQSTVGGIPMQRTGSAGSRNSRAPSALSNLPRDSPVPRGDSSTAAPPLSRTPSTNTITQSRAYAQPSSGRTQPARPAQLSVASPVGVAPSPPVVSPTQSRDDFLDAESTSAIESSSDSSSSDSDKDHPIHRSQLFKRPPRFRAQRQRDLLSYDEAAEEGEENETSTKLPFAQVTNVTSVPSTEAVRDDLTTPPTNKPLQSAFSPSKRGTAGTDVRPNNPDKAMKHAVEKGLDASSSLASSSSDAPTRPGPLSPKHRSDIARQSPHRVGSKNRKDGSEGTPSMGSSFSDIDDAGISQSALEEALLSNIQHGRMSTLSNFRSRYL